jgi:hypothetical protein
MMGIKMGPMSSWENNDLEPYECLFHMANNWMWHDCCVGGNMMCYLQKVIID